jgi:hypothetical protein
MVFKAGKVTCSPCRRRRSWVVDGGQNVGAFHGIWTCMLRKVRTFPNPVLLCVNLALETLKLVEYGRTLWFVRSLCFTGHHRYENRYPGRTSDVWVTKIFLDFLCWYGLVLLMPTPVQLNPTQIAPASMLMRRIFDSTSRTLQQSTIFCRMYNWIRGW